MKKFLFLVLVMLCLSIFTSSAQFGDYAGGVSVNMAYSPTWDVERVTEMEYVSVGENLYSQLKNQYRVSTLMHSLSLNMDVMEQIGQSPFYLNSGGGLRWTTIGNSFDSDLSANFITFRIPIGIAVPITISSTYVNVIPYAGFVSNFNIYGVVRYKDIENLGYEELDCLKQNGSNWALLGWQAGIRIDVDHFYFGISYEGHISNYYKYQIKKEIIETEPGKELLYKETSNFSYLDISIGYRF